MIMRTPERVIMASAKNRAGKLTVVAVKMADEGKKRGKSDVHVYECHRNHKFTRSYYY